MLSNWFNEEANTRPLPLCVIRYKNEEFFQKFFCLNDDEKIAQYSTCFITWCNKKKKENYEWLTEEEQYLMVLQMVCEKICQPMIEYSSQWHLPNQFHTNICKELLHLKNIHVDFLSQMQTRFANIEKGNKYPFEVWLSGFLEWMYPHISLHVQIMKLFDEEFALWLKHVFNNPKWNDKWTQACNDTFKASLHQQKLSFQAQKKLGTIVKKNNE
ncbi:hypothetical protein RFI_02220 [Reticulomyxa filosa]|uniref:Uncharacterized protein n=1 Tax=Reticulomyxa filosa TaxID=46433 RepID=X6P8L7_RETFI|nr:hypothetical protein RFI_02220 [Reticulomyxa filosa]|eukprot:ETO34865.1 hypothetical protein RFI_02220 [Reticulomyxa filosa]